jgi:opacity protein-like surface antigen
MRKLLAAALLTAALISPAYADIIVDTTGQGGTGNNVIFDSVANSSLILGRLNGQNNEVVRFRDISGNGAFSGAANGNDIKIVNTSDLDITVFNSTNLTQLGVTRDIFSIVGTGTMFFHVTALEPNGSFSTFNFGGYDLKNGQNGFDFKAINGEKIWDLDLVNVGGKISDFEHFRIDVSPQAVPGPIVGAGLPGLIAACMTLIGLGRYRRRRNLVTA